MILSYVVTVVAVVHGGMDETTILRVVDEGRIRGGDGEGTGGKG
mgnify:CR=1 FL=1